MKLAKELIRLISDYYASNKLNLKMNQPVNQEYLELLKPDVIFKYFKPYGYVSATEHGSKNIKTIPEDISQVINLVSDGAVLLYLTDKTKPYGYLPSNSTLPEGFTKIIIDNLSTRIDLVIKGAIFLYLNEILSWNEVKVLLNIGTSGVLLYKNLPTDELGAYDVILSLLAVLFGKVNHDVTMLPSYDFKRLTNDVYYWSQPYYYYGYKAALSYGSLNDILDSIDWFLEENTEALDVMGDKYDVLGMLRINNKFVQYVLDNNGLGNTGIETEFDNLGLYNVALNLIRIDESTFGLNNTLFDFYKAVNETTRFSSDGVTLEEIDWTTISGYSKYVNTVINLSDLSETPETIEKVGNVIRNIQNFLIH
jgi:hypothetical protein